MKCKKNICITCHKRLRRSVIPARSVCNKLDIHVSPHDLKNLNRLERTVISGRILFKKVTIMPKGQMPKL